MRFRCGYREPGQIWQPVWSEIMRAWMIAGDRHKRLYPTRAEALYYANIMNRLFRLKEAE